MAEVESVLDRYVQETDADIDYEIQGNVMSITLENQQKNYYQYSGTVTTNVDGNASARLSF